jgi:release factor glutamine methyltransferase
MSDALLDDVPVYPPREDTELLRPFARAARGQVLDVGTGSGALALEAARGGARVTASDVNPFALQRLAEIAQRAALPIGVVRTDLMTGLGRFDVVLANPPYLPTPAGLEDPDRWQDRALNGGPDGARVTARIVATLPGHLRPRGVAYLLVSSLQSARALARIRAAWKRSGGRISVVAVRRLEGESLSVWALRRATRHAGRPRRGSGGHRRGPRRSPTSSSRAPGRGRSRVRDAASDRRRSPRGS